MPAPHPPIPPPDLTGRRRGYGFLPEPSPVVYGTLIGYPIAAGDPPPAAPQLRWQLSPGGTVDLIEAPPEIEASDEWLAAVQAGEHPGFAYDEVAGRLRAEAPNGWATYQATGRNAERMTVQLANTGAVIHRPARDPGPPNAS